MPREVKCLLIMFFQGGAKVDVALDMSQEDVLQEFKMANIEARDVILRPYPDDGVVSDRMGITRNSLLFYSVRIMSKPSGIQVVGANQVGDLKKVTQ